MTEKKNREQTMKNNNHDHQMTRRNFLNLGIGALSALTLLELGAASLLYMKPRSLEGEFGGVVTAGALNTFPIGSVTEFPGGRFFLIRSQDGGLLAIYRRCTHLGCAVSWEAAENRFTCPCHGSHFDINGDVENPPAPSALDTFVVSVEEEMVLVNTSTPLSRDQFSPSQLVYA